MKVIVVLAHVDQTRWMFAFFGLIAVLFIVFFFFPFVKRKIRERRLRLERAKKA